MKKEYLDMLIIDGDPERLIKTISAVEVQYIEKLTSGHE
jgi:hypothetical protein